MKRWLFVLIISLTAVLGILLGFGAGYLTRGLLSARKAGREEPAEKKRKVKHWTCSMHPSVIRNKPGFCPICRMKLVPVYEEDEAGKKTPLPPRAIKLTPAAVALAEIETRPVERRFVEKEVRLVGEITYDETRLAYVTAWVPGRIDKLFVDFTGTAVRKGDHMVYLYSPELYQAQEELLEALKAVETARNTQWSPDLVARAKRTLEAAEEKLRLWGLTDAQIEGIKKRGVPSDHMTIYAPVGGIVIHRNGTEGMYVNTGTRIYTIADLSEVWVMLEAYESDLPWLRYGQKVSFTTEAYRGEVFKGRIAFISPFLNERTRTVSVRVNVENKDGRLKPGMFAHVVVRTALASGGMVMEPDLAGKWICPMHPGVISDKPGSCTICGMPLEPTEKLGYATVEAGRPPLVIPALAPLVTGKRAVVYVRLPGETPVFEGREVVLGPKAGDWYIVLAGLKEGELVVTKGGFKIDAELQIRAKPSMMQPEGGAKPAGHMMHGGKKAGKKPEPGRKKGPAGPMQIPQSFKKSLRLVVIAGEGVEVATHRADVAAVKQAYALLERALDVVDEDVLTGHAQSLWLDIKRSLKLDAVEGRTIDTLKDARLLLKRFEKDYKKLRQIFGLAVSKTGLLKGEAGARKAESPRPLRIPGEARRAFAAFFEKYLDLSEKLGGDDFKGARKAAAALTKAFSAVPAVPELPQWESACKDLQAALKEIKTDRIESLRKGFSILSAAFVRVLKRLGSAEGEKLTVLFCPMAFGGRGAVWVSRGAEVRNPYFGKAMLACGEVKAHVRMLQAAGGEGDE